MKKFITVVPRQRSGELKKANYQAVDNRRLDYGKLTSFPIIPVLHGYAESGETVEVIILHETELKQSRDNFQALQRELYDLQEELPINIVQKPLEISFDDSVQSQLDAFQKLMDEIDDNDVLFCCLTFGGKPVSVMLTMALRYARLAKRNTAIRCVVYGQVCSHDRNLEILEGRIYDETPLLQVDDMLRILAQSGVRDIRGSIASILNL